MCEYVANFQIKIRARNTVTYFCQCQIRKQILLKRKSFASSWTHQKEATPKQGICEIAVGGAGEEKVGGAGKNEVEGVG